MNSQKNVSNKLLKLLDRLMQKKTYGSIEIYFEAGEITQVTQRIINKIIRTNKKQLINRVASNKRVSREHNQISRTEFSETITEI
ncbi:hypothetical protein A2858_04205 [Candidatus Daviesbacteria bacterium RIFCSPHIGHO2_01_FULL_36_37]|uniref:Uncharacterized protein n=4 Tax=Candidatus Daviesiibacteriota TaxID=1752718 RepID=A0A0G0EXT0_9BACT|nr:MAG: hypothetical protein US19_C0007G0007 [Candidatus Daviesbacteria bacterium GW2011_GWB1_36_5]KKQ16361.1 MAG: hypothetical protein US28_C0002G0028 [Candidatus Daviesbacteria bacterium GW2011_GWA1_36_8]OGE16377.1 MAG: hypothetical protein A2858_04205 [Candidatus Daviesbacteria bacterium RIFCSPHIGHO2_01_FULL_36_37]OGE35650.1 MAG: hypothetical protein A3E66_04345 [Candidatus Daviesbacteria bacterium RIFCSPHIGHO2_12_FULL_37_16]